MDIDLPNPDDDDRPSLQDIARKTFDWLPLSDNAISDALAKAGIDPNDERERDRFRCLVHANTYMHDADEIGRVGNYYDQAESEMEPDADPQDVLNEAHMRAWVDHAHEEELEDFYNSL